MRLGIFFHNIGGYHLARIRAADAACTQRGWYLQAAQIQASTIEHPWGDFSATVLTTGPDVRPWLDDWNPDVLFVPGWGFTYSRQALRWCQRQGKRAIAMSESKYDDEPRQWWRESLKSWLYIRHFDGAIVGGQQHKAYLERLGMAAHRIFLGYDAVDNDHFAAPVPSPP
ncbi:MAG: glycosyltransferase family 1 protein, partial [Oscillatoriales cyanobacterium SM2_2_1]|nr:glycosyltransferase family 1 protein [Oscillatoriales cyanobacterium SM2_2_1]